jgi:glycosyltransferase involved in cell wall biosynthesis
LHKINIRNGLVEKLSLLVFSRNDMPKALALVHDMYDYVDEIILVDSSDAKVHDRLLQEKKNGKLEKLRILYAVAFGYPDPLRMYAIAKCSYRWIMLIDTDERISPGLKKDLRKVIGRGGFSAFALRRYEDVTSGGHRPYYNWQIRIFRKDATQFRGMLHEEPIIKGKVLRMAQDDYFMDHLSEIKGDSSSHYASMMKFMRMSYASFNETMVEYLYKYTLPDYRTDKTVSAGWVYRILTGYEILKRKKPGEELSNFDYFVYYFMYSLVVGIRTKSLGLVINSVPFASAATSNIKRWKAEGDSDEIFEISKILHKIGLIKFLDLEKDSTILYLNRKYKTGKQGEGLLMKLLKERYEEDYRGGNA